MANCMHTFANKVFILGAIIFVCFVPLFFYKNDNIPEKYPQILEHLFVNHSKYLVENSKCKIPVMDPFDEQALKFYHSEKYTPCRKLKLLTYVTKSDNIATLHIDTETASSYSKNPIQCCYSTIRRQMNKNKPDDTISISKCTDFKNNVTLDEDFITVKCKDTKTSQKVYENTHTTITITPQIRKKIKAITNSSMPFSIFFVGIDSISRLNFIRSLPKSHQFLESTDWIPLKGYNKIGDNTFPNLMGILTGMNESYAYKICNPKKLGQLDKCPMIWNDFNKFNFVTAYAEDESTINTFNYKKKGFTKSPTDYYFRPYIIASEKLKIIKKDHLSYCTGPETAGERIMNIAKDFTMTFKDNPSFSFFWMNTFSHNYLSSASGMDEKIRNFLEDLTNGGVLNNSIGIFLSDHGLRFGEIRYTYIGWIEERLPFIYIWIPPRFQTQFPQEFKNLKNNIYKLTTPYDLHMTLQHILLLSGFDYKIKPSNACPSCASLFEEINNERSCEDAAIDQHWCTCTGYNAINKNNESVIEASHFVQREIQKIIHNYGSDSKCANYSVKKIISSSISEEFTYKTDIYLLLIIEMNPKAVFEATLTYNNDNNFKLHGSISRLDQYGTHSRCVEDSNLKKYCYCR